MKTISIRCWKCHNFVRVPKRPMVTCPACGASNSLFNLYNTIKQEQAGKMLAKAVKKRLGQ